MRDNSLDLKLPTRSMHGKQLFHQLNDDKCYKLTIVLQCQLQVILVGVVIPIKRDLDLDVLSPAYHQLLFPRLAGVVVHLSPGITQLVVPCVVGVRVEQEAHVGILHLEDVLLGLRGRWGGTPGGLWRTGGRSRVVLSSFLYYCFLPSVKSYSSEKRK